MMSLFSITAAPLISVRLYKLTDKSVQTVYNHTDYARSYHENNSIHEEYPVGFIYYLSYCNKKRCQVNLRDKNTDCWHLIKSISIN